MDEHAGTLHALSLPRRLLGLQAYADHSAERTKDCDHDPYGEGSSDGSTSSSVLSSEGGRAGMSPVRSSDVGMQVLQGSRRKRIFTYSPLNLAEELTIERILSDKVEPELLCLIL